MKKPKGLTIRKMKEILRLHFGLNLTQAQTAKSLNISAGVVSKYVNQAKAMQINWPLPDDMTEQKLADCFKIGQDKAETIDFAEIHKQKQLKAVTLTLLWEEHVAETNDSISYSQFCRRYKSWIKIQPKSMRQFHKAGEKIFVDYSGMTMSIIDPDTFEIRSAEIFVGVLGLSQYTYAEATWTQQSSDWIASHTRMFEYFGGVARSLVPDNLKSAVTKADRYDPDLNPAYYDMASHYSTAIIPARAYKPKDKAKAEGAVCLVQRWILARLRKQTFVGLDELNLAIKDLLTNLNNRAFKKKDGSRKSLFDEFERAKLQSLPSLRYTYRTYKKAKVNIDYHIQLENHCYSIPFKYIGKHIDVWYNNVTVSCYYMGELVAEHIRSNKYGLTTIGLHMPKTHSNHKKNNTREGILYRAQNIGLSTATLIESIIDSKVHEEQAYRTCLGILSLTRQHTKEHIESACKYAYSHNITTRKSIKNIITNNIAKIATVQPDFISIEHSNIRGSKYYH